ncbi:M28 family peptidase [Deinococcus peraridilitoris]|uniref:Putative aminopeptidase n=1 Tax=Deinococcus peraridilitoris (strain DSM 19664 / LMG 22246 / CIP 109416 / KR-200) TaxID=937777 RepID=L0A6D2_DEIPD|nr:M28 family peptidase [Deinococcus peraridilitoris]AFZ69443.1 putative aminopeptidase [Deinococcus peraridilitoris DSM 19664]
MINTQEQGVLDAVHLDTPWALIERFSTLKREDPQDVRQAAEIIEQSLQQLGIPVEIHRPELFLSIPRSAAVRLGDMTFPAKAMAMSLNVPEGLTAPLVYQASQYALDANDVFAHQDINDNQDVRGKIVVTEGFGMPSKVRALEQRGALAVITVNPGERAHWGICTTIWGSPDLYDLPRKPTVAVVNVNQTDGAHLITAAKAGEQATVITELTEGWFESPVPVVTIPGTEETEKFVLLHGHYDSWDYGIGDNAVGDATMLEIARVLWAKRDQLRRSVRIAWWPGHSTGRYAGSTWFADHFGIDLYENCVAQVNCDSPGCRWATSYHDISWMPETEHFAKQVIFDVTGQEAIGERPAQAGDYSFNNIGLSGYFMLLSTMPNDLRAEKGYYAVGGCGGNIAWHTEDDVMDVADRDILLKDIKIYLLSAYRTASSTIIPFDFTLAIKDLQDTLDRYQNAAGQHFSFEWAQQELKTLHTAVSALNEQAKTLNARPLTDPLVRATNEAQLRLARYLVRVNFTREAEFFHDRAESIPALPDLAVAEEIPGASADTIGFYRTHLTRGQNRLLASLRDARIAVERATAVPA